MGLEDRLHNKFDEENKDKITPEVIKQILAEVYILDPENVEIAALELLNIDEEEFEVLRKELRELA